MLTGKGTDVKKEAKLQRTKLKLTLYKPQNDSVNIRISKKKCKFLKLLKMSIQISPD